MEVNLILKIAGIGLLVSVAHQILSKSGREEQATLVSIAGVLIVLFMLIYRIDELFDTVRSVFGI